MISPDVIGLLPSPEGSARDQGRDCLRRLEHALDDAGRDRAHVLALTFFVDATDKDTYRERRDGVLELVRETFGDAPPPASVIAQAPEGGLQCALEAAVLASPTDGVEVRRRDLDGLPYTVVAGLETRVVIGAGLGSDLELTDTASRAREVFATMEAILKREQVTFGHVVRQWNYMEGMLDVRQDDGRSRQGYQALNDVRSLAYDTSEFPAGYPAATGIGQTAGGVILEFVAIEGPPELRVSAVSNPKQVDAHRYSNGVLVGESLAEVPAKTAPKFERAKRIAHGDREIVFVSGTASILGETSVAVGDVAGQTRTTLDNIARLVNDRPLSWLRAYVKRSDDIPIVRRVCEDAYGPIPALYVQADVCRDELLVELEGALVVPDPARERS